MRLALPNEYNAPFHPLRTHLNPTQPNLIQLNLLCTGCIFRGWCEGPGRAENHYKVPGVSQVSRILTWGVQRTPPWVGGMARVWLAGISPASCLSRSLPSITEGLRGVPTWEPPSPPSSASLPTKWTTAEVFKKLPCSVFWQLYRLLFSSQISWLPALSEALWGGWQGDWRAALDPVAILEGLTVQW